MGRRTLQVVVGVGSLVPLMGGGAGMLLGPAMVGSAMVGAGAGDLDSHFRYLSGLLFGLGVGFLSCVPHIESKGNRFRLFTAIVVAGGMGRVLSLAINGVPSAAMIAALAMELAVTPLLALWQWRVECSFIATRAANG